MEMHFPRMLLVRQKFPPSSPLDIPATLESQFHSQGLASRLRPGSRIAISVGSRGIANLKTIVSCAIRWLKQKGSHPFIVPAMGSHGGATPEGQAEILAGYGISERELGIPVKASLDVELIGHTEDGVEVYFSTEALRADGILLINRVKPHTDFSGSIGSGIMKMIAIGLGKRVGASTCHVAASRRGHEHVIRTVAGVSLRQAPILGAIAILENQYHDTAELLVLKAGEIEAREPQLFVEARNLMPRLPFDEIELLIVDRIGKNISGAGMDPNVIGRSVNGYSSQPASGDPRAPRIHRIFVRDLAPESHGNAIGIGLADLTTTRFVRAMDRGVTYINALTALTPQSAKIPIYFDTDREAIAQALASLALPSTHPARVVHISDTLSLERMEVSEAFEGEVAQGKTATALRSPEQMKFDSSDNLLPVETRTQ